MTCIKITLLLILHTEWRMLLTQVNSSTYVHTGIHVHLHTYRYTCTHTNIHVHTYEHTGIHVHIHKYRYICTHTYIQVYMYTYVHTYTYIRVSCTHTNIHVRTYMYTVGVKKFFNIYRPYNWTGNSVPFPFNFRAVAVLVRFQTVPVLSHGHPVFSGEWPVRRN